MKKVWIGWVGFVFAAGIVSATEVPFVINPTLAGSTVNGVGIDEASVTITTNASGNDLVYSFTYENVDLDGGGQANDTLSWELRVEGFTGGVINGGTGMFRVGTTPAQVVAEVSQGWSVGDAAWAIREALQFSVTNIVLTADVGSSVTFDGFESMWLTAGSYYFGEGGTTDPPQLDGVGAGVSSFGAMDVLLITAGAGAERNRELGGSFTVESTEPPVSGGNMDWVGGGADAEWSTAANWSGGVVPGDVAIDIANLFQADDQAIVSQHFASTNMFDLRMRNGASISIGANYGRARRFTIGYNASTSCGISQTDGVVFVRDRLILGYVSAGTYESKYSISGGTLRMTTGTDTGLLIDQHGVFEVAGDSANIDLDVGATDVSITNGGTLAFELAAFDVSPVDVGGMFSIGAGSRLTINAFGYTGGENTITLANFVSKSGTFDEANITITGLEEGLSANITYDATSMILNVTGTSDGPKGRKRVFLLGGQSNMNGLASVTNLVAPYDAVQPNVAFWKNGSWVALAPGYGTRSENFGPEVSFGYVLQQALPIDRIYLVKYAANGTALYDDWAPGTGPQYTEFMSTANAALARLDAIGADYEISGMLWLQGESDAHEGQGAAYETNLRNFIADMRTQFGDPDLPFYIARVADHYGTVEQAGLVRTAQVEVAETTDHVEWFDTDWCARFGGHYLAEGEIQIGTEFANTYLASGPSGTFTGWANEQGLDGTPGKESGFSDDPDQDGVANAMEWISGGNALAVGDEAKTLEQATASNSVFRFAFNREEDSIGRVDLAVEWSTGLTNAWSNSFEVIETSSGNYSKTNGIVVTVDEAPDPDRVTVSVPESFSEDDQLFFRLRATQL